MARIEDDSRDIAYRIYVTDALKALAGGKERYADWIKPQEKRTADEIIGGIREKLGG